MEIILALALFVGVIVWAIGSNNADKKVTIKKEYYPNGRLQRETPFVEGKIEGIEKIYYESGELQAVILSKDGKKNGIEKAYYKNGTIQQESFYKDGKRNGIARRYYESGKLQQETPYQDDKANGISNLYYESGQLKDELLFVDDKINGIQKGYYESGELKYERPWVDDKINGIAKEYYESGELKSKICYEDDFEVWRDDCPDDFEDWGEDCPDEETPQTNYYPEIKRFLEERGIEYLVHFTDAANISSIKRNGLLSRAFLQRRGMEFRFNDNARWDKRLDYISLSITNPNSRVYQSFVNKGSIQRGAFIYIDASILYKESNDRLYCVTNAASTKCPKGRTLSDLERMFDDVVYFETTRGKQWVTRYNKADNEPTYEQAEILYQGSIDPKYIIRIEYSLPMNDDFDDLDDIPF